MRAIVTSVLLSVILAWAALATGCGDEGESKAAPAAPLEASADAVYLGVDSCRECHAERVASYEKTTHFRTLRQPAAGEMAGTFSPGSDVFKTRNPDLRFEMTAEGDRHFLTAIDSSGGEERRRREEIALVMGSGKIFEAYFYWQGNELFQLPVGYLNVNRGWSNCPGFIDGTARFDRAVQPRCLDCHGTWFEHEEGSLNRYRKDDFIAGISCERCHGPANEHVAWHRKHPGAKEPAAIIRPQDFDRRQRLDQCGQCHGDPGTLLAPAFTYRPGTPLEDYMRSDGGETADSFVHTANQIQRLESSACFADERLDCLSCHRTHAPENNVIRPAAKRACLECHEKAACGARGTLPSAVRDDCVSCHMPRHPVADTTFSTATDDYVDVLSLTEHRIGVHPRATKARLIEHYRGVGDAGSRLRADALTKELREDLRRESEELFAARRFVESLSLARWMIRLDPEDAEASSASTRAVDAQQARTRADAWCKLGIESSQAGKPEEAEACFRQALSEDPAHPDANYDLGLNLLERGAPAAALPYLERALPHRSGHADSWNNLGSARAQTGDVAGALTCFKKTIELDPEHRDARLNLANAYTAAKDWDGAVDAYHVFLEKDPENVEALRGLGTTLSFAGRGEEAEIVLEDALRLTPDDPESHFLLGSVLAEQSKWRAARRRLEEAFTRRPDHPATLNLLAKAVTVDGDAGEAATLYYRSLSADPTQAAVHVALAELLSNQRRPDEAKRHLDDARRHVGEDLDVLLRLVAIESALRPEKAKEIGQEALRIAKAQGRRDEALRLESWLRGR